MELQAVTGQLYVRNGEAIAETAVPGLLAQAAPAKAVRGRAGDFLFVHLTLTGQPEETAVLNQDLLDAFVRRYYQTAGSVTAALRRALNQANELLLRLNLSGAGAAREGAITCAVMRHGELFLLQAGESLALLGHNFGIERLPARQPDRITPLGRTAGLDIRYYHQRLQTGDMLLLCDPRLAHLPTQQFETALVDTEVEIGIDELLDVVGNDSARLLLIEFTDEALSSFPEAPRPTRTAAADTAVAAPVAAAPIRQPPAAPAAGAGAAIPEQVARSIRQVDVEHTARKATSEAAFGLSRLADWLFRLMGRLRPARDPNEAPLNLVWPAVIAIAIPLVIAIVVSSVYLQRGRVQRMSEIKQELGQALVLAEDAADSASSRSYYQTMIALADEAEQLRPGDDEITRLRQQAYQGLDRLDGVQRLAARPLIVYADEVRLTAVALQEGFNGGIYTLDSTNSVVLRHDTDESYLNLLPAEPEQLTTRGQVFGNYAVGQVIDLFWRPRGTAVSRDGLAMLDIRGALLNYFPNFGDVRAVPLGLASEWQVPVDTTTFDERLYVLDVGARQIWKYYPEGEGFLVNDEDRVLAFQADAGLETAVDIDIYSEDASLLVVYADGRVRYYDTRSSRIQWDETTLLQNGLSSPLVSPVAGKLIGRGLNTSIFIADAGSGRIVQIGRSGNVLAQYRANDELGQDLFTRMTDFAVAQTPLRIFVTADNVLYVATLE